MNYNYSINTCALHTQNTMMVTLKTTSLWEEMHSKLSTQHNSNRTPNLTTPEQIMYKNKKQSKNKSSNLHELFMPHCNIT